jgi:hypothetical protein
MKTYTLLPVCCLLSLLPLLAGGCARRPAEAPQPPSESATAPFTSADIERPVIRLNDPDGKWEFEARSDHVEMSGAEGPFVLRPAECRYQRPGEPPVLMTADRAWIDRVAQRLELEGSVTISYADWRLETERVDYDLKTGEVVARGQTK